MTSPIEQQPLDSRMAMDHAVERLQKQVLKLVAENPIQRAAASTDEANQLDESYFQRNVPANVHEEQRFFELFGYYPYA